jgi:hypothetical protein
VIFVTVVVGIASLGNLARGRGRLEREAEPVATRLNSDARQPNSAGFW